MIVIPLGIASATPTAIRHLPAVALWREGSVYLFDCGENAQMTMLQAGVKRSKIECIFITHFDVDHYSGLMGLLSTLQLQRREKVLTITGPKGIKEYVEWNLKFSGVELGYEIKFSEVDESEEVAIVVDESDFYVEARPLKHKRFCLGYRFQEKDKPGKVDSAKANELGITEDEQFKELKAGNNVKLSDGTVVEPADIVGHPRAGESFAYITDTEYCPNSVKLAMNTNILFHEATFGVQLADKARKTGHSTTADAARVATESQTKLLVIGHFSARYTNLHVLLKEAREGFYPTWLASELRPIFTDPTHERGIISAKAELKDLTKKSESSGPQKSYGNDRRGSRGRNFRPRRNTGSRDGGYRSNNRYDSDRRGGGRSFDRQDNRDSRDNRYGSNDRYNNRDRDNRNSDRSASPDRGNRSYGSSQYSRDSNRSSGNDEKQPKRSTSPRTSYDDFDRF